MDKLHLATQNLVKVKDLINPHTHPTAPRIAYEKPLKFYLEHTTEEALSIVLSEAEEKADE